MTPNEVLSLPVLSSSSNPGDLVGCRYSHIEELPEDHQQELHRYWHEDEFKALFSDRLRIDTLAYACPDGRRIWQLRTVYWASTPVMILQNAGREGDDHAERFILNLYEFNRMLQYMQDVTPLADGSPHDVVEDLNADMPELTEFYGATYENHREEYLG